MAKKNMTVVVPDGGLSREGKLAMRREYKKKYPTWDLISKSERDKKVNKRKKKTARKANMK